ncbi:amidase [Roseicitreum antarcticum]|uniref:Aspartyl-tRNA(Asn)/glutamyl-tRNA(Gln) amidotransferase subunit A n=1 Tax=Roseicitreum antarcticum TaxID=564137 RepID=A0A1H2TF41_9RHOB|nr:amidase [Roseicitreum antarcticum]SDW42566.1 aspartyl-tRNA(Asn)/glutamyl-tRNA(Gln) amidotransferase subunit A [Roseicitreum antarcticum]
MSDDLTNLSLAEATRQLKRGQLRARAYLEAHLAAIERHDRGLNAFLNVLAESALQQADKADAEHRAGRTLGPLHGIPFAIKDIIDIQGTPTTCHSSVAPTTNAVQDAQVVARLRAAGAVIMGKTALHEFATGGPSFDLPWPPARNPWNRDHHPGGSSSGSAVAVAARMAPAALGTDTAGSVRHPATACGIVGFKPTTAAIGTKGVFPLSWSLDHLGTLTRSTRDAAIIFDSLRDPGVAFDLDTVQGTGDLTGHRIGVFEEFSTGATAEISAAFFAALDLLRDLGAELIPLSVPLLAAYAGCGRLILQAESHALHQSWLQARAEDYSQRGRTRLLAGRSIDAASYINAQRMRRALTEQMEAALSTVDAAVCVSSLTLPCRIDDPAEIDRTYDQQARTPFNLAGSPAVALPIGLSSSGMPMGMQVVGAARSDARVLNVACIYEHAAAWSTRPPMLDPSKP